MDVSWKVMLGVLVFIVILITVILKQREKIGKLKAEGLANGPAADGPKAKGPIVDGGTEPAKAESDWKA